MDATTYKVMYILHGLEATPVVLARLLEGVEESTLDFRPDPERFTLREAIAHLADWDPIWLMRFQRMVAEANPVLESIDEGQMAIERDYAHSDTAAQVVRFAKDRAVLVGFLRGLPAEGWQKTGIREPLGQLTVAELAALVLGHDGYHLRQVVDFTAEAAKHEAAQLSY